MDTNRIKEVYSKLSQKDKDVVTAFSQFNSKLSRTNLCDTIEQQMGYLSDYWKYNKENEQKRELTVCQKEFQKQLAEEIIKDSELLQEGKQNEDSILYLTALSVLDCDINSERIKAKGVISAYYGFIERYLDFSIKWIAGHNDYTFAGIPGVVFENFYPVYTEIRNALSFPNMEIIQKAPTVIKDGVARMKNIENLSSFYYELLADCVLGYLTGYLSLMGSMPVKGVEIKGMNDSDTVRSYMEAANSVKELKLNESESAQLVKSISTLANMLQSNGNSGCMGVLALLVICSALTLALL